MAAREHVVARAPMPERAATTTTTTTTGDVVVVMLRQLMARVPRLLLPSPAPTASPSPSPYSSSSSSLVGQPRRGGAAAVVKLPSPPLSLGVDRVPVTWMTGAVTLLAVAYRLAPGRQLARQMAVPRVCRFHVAAAPRGAAHAHLPRRSALGKFTFLLRIAVPATWSRETALIVAQTCLMLVRAALSLSMARATGRLATAAVHGSARALFGGLARFALLFAPAALLDATLTYLREVQELCFRANVSRYLTTRYLRARVFYRLAGLREVDLIDQRLTDDVQRWTAVSSAVFTSITRPLVEAAVFSALLARHTRWHGVVMGWSYYLAYAGIAVCTAPNMDWMVTQRMEREGALRAAHQRIRTHAAEVAVMRGYAFEAAQLRSRFAAIANYARYAAFVLARYNLLETLYTKYGSVLVYYAIAALALLGRRGAGATPSEMMSRFGESSFAYKTLAKAIGRLLWNIRLVFAINGYTQRLYQLVEGLDAAEHDVATVQQQQAQQRRTGNGNGHAVACIDATAAAAASRAEADPTTCSDNDNDGDDDAVVAAAARRRAATTTTAVAAATAAAPPPRNGATVTADTTTTTTTAPPQQSCGQVRRDDYIEFVDVPLVLPTGEVLCAALSFYVKPGMNLLILGPNGCGKTSTFRLLGELWPLRAGCIVKPERAQLYYLPQRPYLYDGTLSDQIIYPTSRARANVSEAVLYDCLQRAGLDGVLRRPNVSWTSRLPWNSSSVLSAGEKQQLAMARLFYHRPRFAILDECSSTLDQVLEARFYTQCRELGITVLTIAHRRSVWRYHNWILYFDGAGGYFFSPLRLDLSVGSGGEGEGDGKAAATKAQPALVLTRVVSASDASRIGSEVRVPVTGLCADTDDDEGEEVLHDDDEGGDSLEDGNSRCSSSRDVSVVTTYTAMAAATTPAVNVPVS